MKNLPDRQPRPHPLRIVALDQESSVLEFVELVLQREIADFTIKCFMDGNEAWQELSRADPDCLITEFLLPGLSGNELLQRLLDRKAAYRIVVIAGQETFRQNVQDFANRGLNVEFLSKPFTGDELRQAMGQPKKTDQVLETENMNNNSEDDKCG
jgi:FixJ family two-component response regulator